MNTRKFNRAVVKPREHDIRFDIGLILLLLAIAGLIGIFSGY